jgi:hypothetical protein
MPSGVGVDDPRNLFVKSETDAWRLLSEAVQTDAQDFGQVRSITFDGWPTLNIHLDVGEGCVKSSMMRAVVDFQDAVWRSYALVKRGEANIGLLTDEEKDKLELEVFIKNGSEDLLVEAWKTIEPLLPAVINRMDGRHVTICGTGFVVCMYAADVWKAYLQTKLDEMKERFAYSAKLEELSARRFASEQESQRMLPLEAAF